MRIPRSKGAICGISLIVLGAWGALIPLIGPYFNWMFGKDDAWRFTAGQWWLSIIPGIVTIIGGTLLLVAYRRRDAALGSWLALAGGAWFVVGPTVSRLWTDGAPQTGAPYGDTTRQVFEQLTYFSALGALIVGISAFALGRIGSWTTRAAALDDTGYADDRPYRDDPVAYGHDNPAYAPSDEPTTTDDDATTTPAYRRGLAPRRRGGFLGRRDRTPKS